MVLWVEAGSWVFGVGSVSTPCQSSHRRNTQSSHSSYLAGMSRRKSSSCNTDMPHPPRTQRIVTTHRGGGHRAQLCQRCPTCWIPMGKGELRNRGEMSWRLPAAEAAALLCFIPLAQQRRHRDKLPGRGHSNVSPLEVRGPGDVVKSTVPPSTPHTSGMQQTWLSAWN